MRILIGILSLAALSVLAGCAKRRKKAGPEPVPVVTEIVATQRVQASWTYSGEIRPDTEVQLAFKEPGYIAALYRVKGVDGRMRDVQVGDEIPAGATLARLRSSDYEASLNSAVGQQRSAQGTLDASQAELNRAKADQASGLRLPACPSALCRQSNDSPGLGCGGRSAHLGDRQCGAAA